MTFCICINCGKKQLRPKNNICCFCKRHVDVMALGKDNVKVVTTEQRKYRDYITNKIIEKIRKKEFNNEEIN